jgi:serine/threonine protein phosphatase 1
MLTRLFHTTHQTTRPVPGVAAGTRIYAVGDIHGRFDLLMAMLERINADAQRHEDGRKLSLVFLGDFIDRGDDSAQVLDLLMRLSEGAEDRIICLKGNHEDALLRFIDDPEEGQAWLEFGGLQTCTSYGLKAPARSLGPDALKVLASQLHQAMGPHIAFLRSLPLFHISGNVAFAHAGMNPADGRDTTSLLWGHPEFLKPNPIPGLRVVHGHYDHIDPVIHPGRVCVDTGAYYSGTLTAVRLDGETGVLNTDMPLAGTSHVQS